MTSTSDNSYQFVCHYGVSRPYYEKAMKERTDEGWSMKCVSITIDTDGNELFSTIWEQPGKQWSTLHGVTMQDLEKECVKQREQGMQMVSICAYNSQGNEPLFAAVWHYDPDVKYVTHGNMSGEQYQKWLDYYHVLRTSPPCMDFNADPPPIKSNEVSNSGFSYRLRDVSAYTCNGEVKFIAVWCQDGIGYYSLFGLHKQEFDWQTKEKGFEPTRVSAYTIPDGGVRFTKTWSWNPNAVRFCWGHFNETEIKALIDLKCSQGYRLIDISAHVDSCSEVKYLSVWESPDPKMLKLALPIGGVRNKDWILMNYQDHGKSGEMVDYMGGQWLYKGHNGTDFAILSFAQMDAGVDVYACDDGVVVEQADGIFDRNVVEDVEHHAQNPSVEHAGNYVVIEHANGQRTSYSHLRKGSVLFRKNDKVKRGEKTAEIGSSGNSSAPHLHFAVLNSPYSALPRDGNLVDPFEGVCGNGECLWMAQLPYQKHCLAVLDGDTTDHEPTTAEFTERVPKVRQFKGPFNDGTKVYFWIQWSGTVSDENTLSIKLVRPDGSVEWSDDVENGSSRMTWAYYFYDGLAGMCEGCWTWVAAVNGKDRLVSDFVVLNNAALTVVDGDTCDHYLSSAEEFLQRIPKVGKFTKSHKGSNKVYFWAQFNGTVSKTNTLCIKLLRPNDTVEWSTEVEDGTSSGYYQWYYDGLSSMCEGTWKWVACVNGDHVLVSEFNVV